MLIESPEKPDIEEQRIPPERKIKGIGFGTVVLGLLPLAALGLLVWLFIVRGDEVTAPIRQNEANLPIPESVSFERIVFKPSQIVATVRNTGPKDFTIADVHINDMATQAYISPSATIPRLSTAKVTIPHDWVEGDPYEIRLVSSTGLFYAAMVDVAATTPTPSASYLWAFALLGVLVGVVPVYLGLLWFPLLRKLGESAMSFFLAFTVGLLVFLGVDSLEEALEVRGKVGGPLQPTMLILIGTVATFLVISWISGLLGRVGERKGGGFVALSLAYMIAFGIGIHNLGEGLAIGAAYSLGEVSLGGLLVLGFMIHNTTEGIAIVAPVARTGAKLRHLVLMGLLGGVPTIFGAWIGGFAYSPIWSLLFLSVGAGAVLQVVYVIVKGMLAERKDAFSSGPAVAGLLAGLAVMYFTGMMVA
ncbi:MAG: ZIP family metal transporter [Fimbriimonadaceae bacterium]